MFNAQVSRLRLTTGQNARMITEDQVRDLVLATTTDGIRPGPSGVQGNGSPRDSVGDADLHVTDKTTSQDEGDEDEGGVSKAETQAHGLDNPLSASPHFTAENRERYVHFLNEVYGTSGGSQKYANCNGDRSELLSEQEARVPCGPGCFDPQCVPANGEEKYSWLFDLFGLDDGYPAGPKPCSVPMRNIPPYTIHMSAD